MAAARHRSQTRVARGTPSEVAEDRSRKRGISEKSDLERHSTHPALFHFSWSYVVRTRDAGGEGFEKVQGKSEGRKFDIHFQQGGAETSRPGSDERNVTPPLTAGRSLRKGRGHLSES